MKITFSTNYHTVWGETVGVMIKGIEQPLMLDTVDGHNWSGTISLKYSASCPGLDYSYGIYRGGKVVRSEARYHNHYLPLGDRDYQEYRVGDCWQELPSDNFLYSSALSGQLEDDECRTYLNFHGSRTIILRAVCPRLRSTGRVLGLSGSAAELGAWDPAKAVVMHELATNEWVAAIDRSSLSFPLEYKFISLDAETHEPIEWEAHQNRVLYNEALSSSEVEVLEEQDVWFPSSYTKAAGSAIPVFSLRSEGSCGVGDFGDLKKYIDWAVHTSQRAVQILPINDTTITGSWTDSYPYNSISIYAFHPMYIDLRQLGALKDKKAMKKYEDERRRLNALSEVDYEEVNRVKRGYIRAKYEEEGKKLLKSDDFKKFYVDNEEWLMPYAAFSVLRDQYGTPCFSRWPEHSVYNESEIKEMCDADSSVYQEIALYYYIQYQLHLQLTEASRHARENNIILKGDIPIGISRDSVEAWKEPHYFNLSGQAGAPPDAFSTKGQNWGFPTYDWDEMAKDGYQWWRRRFSKMSEYFSAYRIDHILGFFRIWEIPMHSVHGLLGQFVPALPMSEDEIRGYGLNFQRDFMTLPFINEQMLWEMFGERQEYVKEQFLRHEYYDIWQMKPEFDTQRKVEAWFADKQGEEWDNMKEGLYALISNVLFVRDRDNEYMYHPRIAVQSDYIYQRLTWEEQQAFNRLYNDYYYRRHNQFWYEQAMKKLPTLTRSTPMLVCGEDLGMVPDCVQWVMKELQILSLEIQRMPKNPEHEFGHVWEYPANSVCTISTHDMSTLRGWWEEDYQQTDNFYHHVLGHWDETPVFAPGWVCEEIVRRHLECPSVLCILNFQDWLSIDEDIRRENPADERINVPANPRHYWRYRMHLTLEQLMKEDEFNNKIRTMIKENWRA